MSRRLICALVVGVPFVAGSWSETMAQGLVVADRPLPAPLPRLRRRPVPVMPLTVNKLAASTEIVDAVAITRIEQVFGNPTPQPVEGTYIFPLDDDISVSKFSMYMDGKEVVGQVLGRGEARRRYEEIVSRMRDPALLEYLGTRMYQARIFPIRPGGEAKIELAYTQTLPIDAGLVRYRLPMSTAKHATGPIGSLSLLVGISSGIPIKDVFSPTHDAATVRSSDARASASFEATRHTPDRDFLLLYSLSEKEFGLSLLTYREPGDDGFFLARLAPKARLDADDVLPKDICFVVDVSGSMAGEKLAQAQRALRFCLANLNPEDRFNVVTFSHEPWSFRDEPVSADPETVKQAREAVDALRANGGTNINDAVLAAMRADPIGTGQRPYLVVLLTDGQPTVGVTDLQSILANVREANTHMVRLFVFGIGTDVNTKLLDRLAEENRGARDYVSEDEDIEVKVSSFYRKVSNPVLSELRLAFGDLSVHDVYPRTLPDLFAGSEVTVVGRFSGFGHRAVELTGKRRGREQRFVYESDFPSVTTRHDFVPRLWAVRKVAYLQDQIRLHGENKELKDAIVELAKQYGIITDYTAYLVMEEDKRVSRSGGVRQLMAQQIAGSRELERRAAAAPLAEAAMAGLEANRVSMRNKVMAEDSAVAYDVYFGGSTETSGQIAAAASIRRIGNRTFYNVEDRWVDQAHTPGRDTIEVPAFSETYFELANRSRDIARAMALGGRVVFVVDGQSYEVVPAT
jgi:Ca-activated chloride channel family protein